MATIKLNNNKETIVDDEDFEYLNQWKWYYSSRKYVVRNSFRKDDINRKQYKISMHRIITKCPEGKEVDHINHNTLDNRKCNLRICSTAENQANSNKHKDGSSKYKGVSWNKANKKWVAYTQKNNKRIYLGYFKNEIDAAKAYNEAAIKYHKEFAKLNELTKKES